MVGKPKSPNKLLAPRKKHTRKPYTVRDKETRGITYKEPAFIGSFWSDYNMDQVQAMTDQELMQAIDKFLDGFIARSIKRDRYWDFPIKEQYLRIASLPKK